MAKLSIGALTNDTASLEARVKCDNERFEDSARKDIATLEHRVKGDNERLRNDNAELNERINCESIKTKVEVKDIMQDTKTY